MVESRRKMRKKSGKTNIKLVTNLYMVSASTSPNQTRRFGMKFCPVSSSMATSPPPFSCRWEAKAQSNTDRQQGGGGFVYEFSGLPVSSRPQAQAWRATGRGPCPRRKCTQPCLCWWLSRRRRRWSSPCLVPLGMEWPGAEGGEKRQLSIFQAHSSILYHKVTI